MFTKPELFDLEMKLIFEKTWIYTCHEREIPDAHDLVTRQPLIVSRDGMADSTQGLKHASNATLTRPTGD